MITFWSKKREAELVRLLGERKTCSEISEIMEISILAIKSKKKRMGLTNPPAGKSWTDGEVEKLLAMRALKVGWSEIGKRLGRPSGSCHSKFSSLKKARRVRQSASNPVPATVMEEWTRRLMIGPRDLTASICGDPLPGFSALDRRVS